jgi:hypothetical protein
MFNAMLRWYVVPYYVFDAVSAMLATMLCYALFMHNAVIMLYAKLCRVGWAVIVCRSNEPLTVLCCSMLFDCIVR